MYLTDIHQLLRIGRRVGADERSIILCSIAQGTFAVAK